MHRSDPQLILLHALRLRGLARDESLAAILGEQDGPVAQRYAPLIEAGLVKQLTGRMNGFMLTRDGRARHGELLEADKAAGALTEVLHPPYQEFLEVNQPFIDLCSSWQVRSDDGQPNDHTDEAYDAKVIGELGSIHEVGAKVGKDLAGVAQRYASYGPRLETAIGRVRAGDREWFTKPVIDSYHTVWFELHEDLLVSQGIERAEGR